MDPRGPILGGMSDSYITTKYGPDSWQYVSNANEVERIIV